MLCEQLKCVALLAVILSLLYCRCPDRLALAQSLAGQPQPGSLYKEFSLHNGGDRDWRVTDDQAVDKFPRAQDHLPNSKLELTVDDLEHAVAAEVMLDRWGGHRGTINKRLRFNGKDWITIPEIAAVPKAIRPEMLMYQDNPVVNVSLDQIVQGVNFVEADCDEAGGFGWGQWGLYSLTLRIYYDPKAKGEKYNVSGAIESPPSGAVLADGPDGIRISVAAEAFMGVARIDVLASYDGYDENGDGKFSGWHESHFQPSLGQPSQIRDHVGTLWKQPYALEWETCWIPDQPAGGVELMARIQDARGYWTVTEPVKNLTLQREDVTVKLYRAQEVPEDFAVRVDDETKSCFFDIPETDLVTDPAESALHLRTWHGWDGHHEPIKINEHEMAIGGKNHFYDYDLLPFPSSVLKPGQNTFTIHSTTEHHMLEVLWPGPAIVTRTPLSVPDQSNAPNASVKITEATYQDRPHYKITTTSATYWLDSRSGGLARLIDPDGNDWIAFKQEPWDQYPPSAASSFRGIPNLVFQGDDKGFGHPGWDRAQSTVVDENSIVCVSSSGQWQLRWDFSADEARLMVQKAPDQPYWFLYEGPIAGRWQPTKQYFATDITSPSNIPHDFFAEDKLFGKWKWAYFGDQEVDRVLYIVHQEGDDAEDTFSHLGNSEHGLNSDDGMVVFGFGRGAKGLQPLLTGQNTFRLGLIEQRGQTQSQYDTIKNQLKIDLENESVFQPQ